jgi:hypothetical protein
MTRMESQAQYQPLLGQSLMQQLVTNMQASLIQEISKATLEYEPENCHGFRASYSQIILQNHHQPSARQRGLANGNDADVVGLRDPKGIILLLYANTSADK